MKQVLRHIGLTFIRLFGSTIRDQHDGMVLGRALVISWAGSIHLIGYEGPPLKPVFLAPQRLLYWRCAIGFTRAEIPDFLRILPIVATTENE